MDAKLFHLITVVTDSWSRCLPMPYGDGRFCPIGMQTLCNDYVNYVCHQLGYEKLAIPATGMPMLANDMSDYLRAHPEEWMPIPGMTAQWHANNGALVIAAWKNTEGPHGHVSIVYPGELGSSEAWSSQQVPKVANVGQSQFCKIGVGANWCFHNEPTYYALKSMLM